MKIVIDTNILMSGIFFGGYPGKIVESALTEAVTAVVTPDIVREYMQTVEKMIQKGAGHAKDSGAICIVSGGKDLLDLKKFENVPIFPAKQFCDVYL